METRYTEWIRLPAKETCYIVCYSVALIGDSAAKRKHYKK